MERKASQDQEKKLAAIETVGYKIGGNMSYVYNHWTKSSRVVPSETAAILGKIHGFKTLMRHARSLEKEGIGFSLAMTTLKECKDKDFMVEQSFYLNQLAKIGVEGTKIDTVGWVTCERSESLKGSLESFIINFRKYGREPRLVVIDDSRSSYAISRNKKVLASLCQTYGLGIGYAGLAERRALVEILANRTRADGVPKDIIRFGLLGHPHHRFTFGAARNSLLLNVAGQPVLSCDDDVFCRIATSGGSQKRLTVTSDYDPTVFTFFPDRLSLLNKISFRDNDILASHEHLLGKSLIGSLQTLGDKSPNLEDAAVSLLNRLSSGSAQVNTTMAGYVGDSGMGSVRYLLGLKGTSRKRLTTSERVYETALKSREVLRLPKWDTLCESNLFIGGNIGIDARTLVPPFFPVFRNEDGIFATVLRTMKKGVCGHLPVAVYHNPPNTRLFEPGAATRFQLDNYRVIHLVLEAYTDRPVF